MTPAERARKAADVMWAGDSASQWLGMELVSVGEGCATLRLQVRPQHANGHGICHGGIIFSLADSAFAFACNSRNRVTVAQFNQITYIAPARVGDMLIATAEEVSVSGRNGIYDVGVATPEGADIARFRGHSRAIGGTLFDEDDHRRPE